MVSKYMKPLSEKPQLNSKSDQEAHAIQKTVNKLKRSPLYIAKFLLDMCCGINSKILIDRTKQKNQRQFTLLNFLIDCEAGMFRKWHIFQTELGIIKEHDFKGRSLALHKTKGAVRGESDRIGQMYDQEKNGIGYINTLPLWKCKTATQKIKMISDSDIPFDVKVDFLSSVVID